jgi:hypothetical protein
LLPDLKKLGVRKTTMLSKLKAAWNSLGGGPRAEPSVPTEEYKGYRIKPTPYRNGSNYQTAGAIEKDMADGVKTHTFVRADTHASREDAVAFTIGKAKQLIDLQGEQIFK